jgi:integrase
MASIRRKGRSWQVVHAVYAGGRRVQRTRNFASMAAARQHKAQVELLEQRGVGNVRTTFGDYLQGWLTVKVADVEANTAAGYRRWVGHIVRHSISRLPLERVTPLALEQCYRELLETPAGRGKPLSPTSVRHCHAVLANALSDAVRQQRLPGNPALYAKTPRGQSPRVAVPDAMQIGALLDDLTARDPELGDLALLIVGTGARRSEALGLRWGDLDWTASRITIRQVVIEHDGRFSIREGTKSRAGHRTIGIASPLLDALRRQQARAAAARLKLGRFWQDHDLVFPDHASGGPRSPHAVTNAFARAARRAGWPERSSPVHSLRHAAASLSLASGVDIGTVAQRLGHSSPAITAGIYIHGDNARDRAAAEIMVNLPRRKLIP